MIARLVWCVMIMLMGVNPSITNANQETNSNVNTTLEPKQPEQSIILEQVGLKHKKLRNGSREAAVSVITVAGQGSGTYFKIGDHYIVITAYHVVENQDVVIIIGRNDEQVYGQPIIKSVKGDIAILLVPKISSRTPMKLKTLSEKQKLNINKLIGDEVTYTGFPGHHDLLTVDGKIANVEDGSIIIHSYAWPGASGSGVFDFKGRFMGVVSAVDLGQWHPQIPPAIVEDMVWVSPSWNISKKDIELYLDKRGSL